MLFRSTTLETSNEAASRIAAYLSTVPEVVSTQVYAGTSAPFNFNGLVRHYFMRRGANVADIQVNLVSKNERKAQSHDIAKRVRPRVTEIAAKYGARVALFDIDEPGSDLPEPHRLRAPLLPTGHQGGVSRRT